mmetsp:Transcript_20671/g.55181  ORF Transcript_20671/g.55181 Transcript_20671/m.55181 type:complete len:353 (+) Transcript_20671:238-1296(+)
MRKTREVPRVSFYQKLLRSPRGLLGLAHHLSKARLFPLVRHHLALLRHATALRLPRKRRPVRAALPAGGLDSCDTGQPPRQLRRGLARRRRVLRVHLLEPVGERRHAFVEQLFRGLALGAQPEVLSEGLGREDAGAADEDLEIFGAATRLVAGAELGVAHAAEHEDDEEVGFVFGELVVEVGQRGVDVRVLLLAEPPVDEVVHDVVHRRAVPRQLVRHVVLLDVALLPHRVQVPRLAALGPQLAPLAPRRRGPPGRDVGGRLDHVLQACERPDGDAVVECGLVDGGGGGELRGKRDVGERGGQAALEGRGVGEEDQAQLVRRGKVGGEELCGEALEHVGGRDANAFGVAADC